MLTSFVVVSLGAYGFNSRGLVHQIDHDLQTLGVSADHGSMLSLGIEGDSTPQPLSDIEHKLLHALTHFESMPNSAFNELEQPPARIAPLLLPLLTLSSIEIESPFRPPRITARI